MKKVILFFVIVCAVSSCKKEYTCSDGKTYGKGTIQYQQLKNGTTITDYSGQELHCF